MSSDYHEPLKSDRQQWKKSNNKYFDFDLTNSFTTQHQAEQFEAHKRYEDYLLNLHLNNKISKIASKKDKKKEELERLENGFNLFTNGAHQSKEKFTPRYTTAIKSVNSKKQHFSTRVNVKSSPLLRYLEEQQGNERFNSAETAQSERKRWENASFCLKTTDGCQIKISGPNQYNNPPSFKNNDKKDQTHTDYSYDFESESEEELKNNVICKKKLNKKSTKNNGKNLIDSVQFSDCSDNDESDKQSLTMKKKDLLLQLTTTDVKELRKSLNQTNFSLIRESLLVDKRNQNESDNVLESIEDNSSCFNVSIDNSIESSSMCDFIIKQAVGLKKKERENLLNFLSNVDELSTQSD